MHLCFTFLFLSVRINYDTGTSRAERAEISELKYCEAVCVYSVGERDSQCYVVQSVAIPRIPQLVISHSHLHLLRVHAAAVAAPQRPAMAATTVPRPQQRRPHEPVNRFSRIVPVSFSCFNEKCSPNDAVQRRCVKSLQNGRHAIPAYSKINVGIFSVNDLQRGAL